jgi:hypothetical protein
MRWKADSLNDPLRVHRLGMRNQQPQRPIDVVEQVHPRRIAAKPYPQIKQLRSAERLGHAQQLTTAAL